MGESIFGLTELAEAPSFLDWFPLTDVSDTAQSVNGSTRRNKGQYLLGSQVNAQTGTTYTYLTTDFRKLVTHTNASAIAGTLPQAGTSFPAGWYMFVQNRGAGALTITPTTSTIDGAATLLLNQHEGALVVSDGTNYFTFRGKVSAAGTTDLSSSIAFTGDISPAQITASQNDYNPTGLATASTLRLSTDASRNITGLAGGSDGRIIIIHNAGSNPIVLKDEDSGSSAANRCALTQDVVLLADDSCVLQYDSTTSRWRLISDNPAAVSPPFETLTDGATITWALGSRRNANATVTLGGNRTLSITGAVSGATGVLIVKQDGTGSRTLTLPASSKVVGGGAGAITLTTAASAIDIISFYYDGTNYFWTYGKNFT